MQTLSLPGPRSVRSAILSAFGIFIVILAVCIGGAVITVKHYQSSTAEMQRRANIASQIQTAEANGSIAALLLQRYVIAGDAYLVSEIQLSAASATSSLNTAAELEGQGPGEAATVAGMTELSASSATLVASAQQVIQLKQAGQTGEAAAAMEQIVPIFRDFRLQLIDMANKELAEVNRLQDAAGSAGNLAVTLIIVSGAVGSALALFVAIFVARSIIRPLSRLEETALSVALGTQRQ